ncbi:MAG: 50S ribosomal protein L23 [Chloroflexota bacterium]|nr:50S ribosomal protein L23 [Chloroflexota bacterium]
MHSYEVLRRPLITEKSMFLAERSKYAFEVDQDANKRQIKDAVEKAFKVQVTSVNVIHMPGKMRRAGRRRGMTPSWKKAVVTLRMGDKIELFEGV